MKRWYCLFTKESKPVMGCWIEENGITKTEDDAITAAGFKAYFTVPDRDYDEITITQTKEVAQ